MIIAYASKVFLPTLSIAFEYQGETHYYDSRIYGSASKRQRNDHMKKEFARREGITLILVPFWWDGSEESLASAIRVYRKDVLSDVPFHLPIPQENPIVRYKHAHNVAHDKVRDNIP